MKDKGTYNDMIYPMMRNLFFFLGILWGWHAIGGEQKQISFKAALLSSYTWAAVANVFLITIVLFVGKKIILWALEEQGIVFDKQKQEIEQLQQKMCEYGNVIAYINSIIAFKQSYQLYHCSIGDQNRKRYERQSVKIKKHMGINGMEYNDQISYLTTLTDILMKKIYWLEKNHASNNNIKKSYRKKTKNRVTFENVPHITYYQTDQDTGQRSSYDMSNNEISTSKYYKMTSSLDLDYDG